MKPQKKKGSVKKDADSIEFCLGDAGPTKYEIMTAIAKRYTVYGATVWLNEPLEELGGKSPAKLMLEGDLETVAKLIKDSNERDNM